MLIRDIMKQNPSCISEEATLKSAAQAMEQIGCGILPVVRGDAQGQYSKNPIGVVTDRDIVTRCVAQGLDPQTTLVREAMTAETITCNATSSMAEAFETMRNTKVGRLLVLDESSKLCGIVTMADIIGRVPNDVWEQFTRSKVDMPRNTFAA